ncbi:MAG: hypothetical protein CBARDCOR_3286 [uncultured Caballeronia sp.]|nr:MAG: hypothetical protein CBARDCOR_3286 [uncultured Caballeronia sp.]
MLKENTSMLREISEFNRSYLLLAQRALREGDIKGGQLFGMSDETAVLISQLTAVQIENFSIAVTSFAKCAIRSSRSDGADLLVEDDARK